MVRHQVKSIFEGMETETKPRGRHTISHPPDNIGVSCTVQGSDSEERILPGRRRVLIVPRDNIGIACLPMADRLDNIAELPEYESSDEDIEKKMPLKFSQNRRSSLPQATVRARMNSSRDEIISTNQSTQGEIGISNVRRPKDDPTKPRKPILPRDNIGFACKPLYKSAGRLSGSRLSTGLNYKNSSNLFERKNFLRARSPTENTRNNGTTTSEQIDTLRTVSKLSVLLLYIHFLLTYYLSYAKSHRYGEIFDSCPTQDVHE